MTRCNIWFCLFYVAACADDGSTQAEEHVDAGQERDLEELSASVINPLVGMYHLVDRADAINLELRDDRTFRWAMYGCDVFGGDHGRVRADSPTSIVLVPEASDDVFYWSTVGTKPETEIHIDVSGDRFIEPIDGFDITEQYWERGGVCAVCGGGFGPTGQEPCDEPNFTGF